VTALEEHLAELRKEDPRLDIDLVVGTSGDAINSLPIALGIPVYGEGAPDCQQVWEQLDQREIVGPLGVVHANIGFWFALLQIAIVIHIVTSLPARPHGRTWSFSLVLLIVGLAEVTADYVPVVPWCWLGKNHLVHHTWLWCGLGIRWSAWCLMAVGILGMLFHGRQRKSGQFSHLPV